NTMELVQGFEEQTVQVLENLKAVIEEAGGSIKDVVKLNIFLTDLSHFAKVNEIMGRYFEQPYPSRAAIGVAALPRGGLVEVDGTLVIGWWSGPPRCQSCLAQDCWPVAPASSPQTESRSTRRSSTPHPRASRCARHCWRRAPYWNGGSTASAAWPLTA